MTATLEPTATTTAAPTGGPLVGRRRWIAFTVILAATIMDILDSTIVNVAAPSIQRDLGTSSSQLEWVAAAYTLAIAVGLLPSGRLGDRLGRKRLLMLGLAGFVGASVLCAAAWSPESLIAARVLQGLAAAVLTPQTFGLIRDIFGPAEMGKAFAAFGPTIGLSTVAGPVVAGLLINWNPWGSDWRSLFLINVPLGVFALAVGARVLPSGRTSWQVRIDVRGSLLMAVVAFALVFPLVDGRTLGWPVWIFGVLAAAVPLLAVFVVHQRRQERTGRATLVETSVLRKRSYVSGIVFVLVFFGALTGFTLTMGLFLQVGVGMTALHASLYLMTMSIGTMLGAGIGSWAATAVGRPILHAGLAVMAAGTVVLLVALHGSGPVPGFWTLTPGLCVFGLGMGQIFVPLFSIVTGEIDDHEVGTASGLLEALQQLGASLGVAVLATLFFARLDLGAGGPRAAMAAGRHLTAIEATLWVTLGLCGLAFVLAGFLPRRARAGQH